MRRTSKSTLRETRNGLALFRKKIIEYEILEPCPKHILLRKEEKKDDDATSQRSYKVEKRGMYTQPGLSQPRLQPTGGHAYLM